MVKLRLPQLVVQERHAVGLGDGDHGQHVDLDDASGYGTGGCGSTGGLCGSPESNGREYQLLDTGVRSHGRVGRSGARCVGGSFG